MTDFTYYELTHPQKRIWYIEKIYPDTSLYNIGGITRFRGQIDFTLLEEAIHIFIRHNAGLRLQLVEDEGTAKQYVADYAGTKLDFVDFSSTSDPLGAFEKWREEEPQKACSLLKSPLYKFTLFRIHENDGGYLTKIHHIIADGWSMDIMTKGICEIYGKLALRERVTPESHPSYLEYIAQEQEYLHSPRFLKNKQFWNDKFQTLPDSLSGQGYNDIAGRRKTYQLSLAESEVIKSFCKLHKISLNTFFGALFLIYLYKSTGQQDLLIGTPILNRSGQKEKAIFGMFTSTMPLRVHLHPKDSVLEFIQKVNREFIACFFHQKYPYNLLVADLELKRKGFDSLFEVCVNYYNTKLDTEVNGIKVENTEFYNGNQFYALQMIIRDWSDERGLILDFDYQVDRYDEYQIAAIYRQLRNLETKVTSAPGMAIRELGLLSEKEKEWLIHDFNKTKVDYPEVKTIHQLFEEQALRTPERIALSFAKTDGFSKADGLGKAELSYQELNRKANQLAGFIQQQGTGPGSIVVLLTTHSLETVIAILAILKAGAAYLPIDPGYPTERIHYMLQDSGAALILSNCVMEDDSRFQGRIFMLTNPDLYSGSETNPQTAVGPHDPVYIIYTSGSTGKPKGVVIEHRGLVNYIWWAKKMYIRSEAEACALYSSLVFDLTVTSIFTPLISGNKIEIYHDDGSNFILDPIMEENRVNIIKLTPSHLSLLKDRDHRGSMVQRFIVGGEDLKTGLASRIQESFGGAIEIYNEYGPTETVVGCMIHLYKSQTDGQGSVPIGVPADNVQIYILDQDLQPVPPGAMGELYIAGDGVARGYLNRPELTAEKFISNPFISDTNVVEVSPIKANHEGTILATTLQLMYKTGDLARFLENGKIEYCGRRDHQVKIRGHRIELGEIEGFLQRHPLVKNGVVIDREDSWKQKYLCAYYESDVVIPESDFRDHLLQSLPESMIPSYFVKLDQIPLTSNGKVNRSLLPEPPTRVRRDFVPKFTGEHDAKLAAVIGEILNLEMVSPYDNFYHLGGDSIKAIQIAAKLKNHGFQIKVKDILSNPLIREMAAHLNSVNGVPEGASVFQPCEGPVEMTPITAWFLAQNLKNPNHWNQSVLLNLKPELDESQIEAAINTLIQHHDTLRLNYAPQTGKLVYNPAYVTQPYEIETFDLAAVPEAEQEFQLELLGGRLKSGFNIETGLLLKVGLFNLGPCGKRLLLTAHHLVVDGISWRIILDDFASLLEQGLKGQTPKRQSITLPPKTASFQKWALEVAAYGERLASKPEKSEVEYWEAVVGEPFWFPVDDDLGATPLESSATLIENLDGVSLEAFNIANGAYNTRTHELLVIGLALAVSILLGREKIVIELEGHGREEVVGELDISRTVGWFTTMYPVCLQVENIDLASRIKSLKEQLRRVSNQGFGFGILKYLAGLIGVQPPVQLRFNYLGDFGDAVKSDFFELAHEKSGPDCAPDNAPTCLLELNVLVVDKSLQIRVTYSPRQFRPETIRNFIFRYQEQLQEIIAHCHQKDQTEFTPSDFDTVDLSQADLNCLFGD